VPPDLNDKDPLVGSSSEWARPSSSSTSSSSGRRTSERRRRRRRSRKHNDIRAKIRLRIWIACTGALLAMALVLYLALERDRPSESGHLGGPSGTIAGALLGAAPAA
jgi:hypothetical protein